MRFSIHFLFMVMAFVAAFFAGRASLVPVIREQKRRDVLQTQQIHIQSQAVQEFEKAQAAEKVAAIELQQIRSEKELRRLDWMLEMERARSPRHMRPELLVPDRVTPKTP
jgi:hypothetical protein